MIARATLAYLLLCAGATLAQDSTWVEVSPNPEDPPDVERRYTSELVEELRNANDDALLLYTEYSSKSGERLAIFLQDMRGFVSQTMTALENEIDFNAPDSCRNQLKDKLNNIEYNARRAAHFSAENHHKFLLGHMIVFRMHLNKSEEFIKKCDKAISNCGVPCEKSPRVQRWRRHAADELHRFRDDLQHSRRSYRDLLTHAHRKLNHIRRQVNKSAKEAIDAFRICAKK
ncbi:uncharacterized protein LOC113518971 isoform X1 [Galleria mellonella]|uniref:Uncharacterized protein LOC113518971 isoform X1 n=1 Tax=Galleria mellonella TaxID=7137 RepID=A0A6J1X2H6_GALME|nr:uncharacterized protein LOC113518971 isoform X1 [Galleria mellonella]